MTGQDGLTQCWCHYTIDQYTEGTSQADYEESMNLVFANCSKDNGVHCAGNCRIPVGWCYNGTTQRPVQVCNSACQKHHDPVLWWQTCHPQGFTRQNSCMVSSLPPTLRFNPSQRDSLYCNALEQYEANHQITCKMVSQLPGDQTMQAKDWDAS